MKRVLILGAGGFIGRHAVAHLLAAGHEVYATCRPGRQPPPIPARWVACDLTQADSFGTLPRSVDAVIHLAQARRWRSFPDDAPEVFAVNVQGIFNAAWFARQAGARIFIYASSGTVYSQTRQPAVEAEPIDLLAPRSFYAASRLGAEVLLRPFETLFAVVQLRLFMPYGLHQNPDMLLPSLVHRVRHDQPISLHGEGGLLANPVAVADVAEALRRALDLRSGTTVNVAGPEVQSLRELSLAIGKAIGREPRFVHQAGEPPVIVGDTALLHETLGWRPGTTFADGLRAWFDASAGLPAVA